ncbi:MAG: LamG-like jellyroll fold domain-containing protein [Acidobacteriota bacterium]
MKLIFSGFILVLFSGSVLAQVALVDPRDLVGNILWLDGNDVDGDYDPEGSFPEGTRWIDKSTQNNANARQETISNRPTIVTNGLNGLSVVRFDGDDYMDVDPAAFDMLNGVSGATLFAVVMTETRFSQRVFMISTDQSQRTRAGLNLFDTFGTNIAGTGNFGVAGRRLDADPFQRIEGGTVELGKFNQYAGVLDYTNSTVELFVNGNSEASSSGFQSAGLTSATNSANIRLGADAVLGDLRASFQGDLAELIAYDRALNSVERGMVEAYLEQKWFLSSAEVPETLYFSQFGNGQGLTSEIVLTNPSATDTISGEINFFDDQGLPLSVGIAGTGETTRVDFSVMPLGAVTISTDGQGEVTVGSAVVSSDRTSGGVVRFDLFGIGIAGVPPSQPLSGFVTPVRRKSGGINTGVAIYNISPQAVALNLTLQDAQGKPVPNGETNIEDFPARGHLARFLGGAGEVLFPDADTEDFQGTLAVRVTGGNVAATALELGTQPGEFTTLPVTPLE